MGLILYDVLEWLCNWLNWWREEDKLPFVPCHLCRGGNMNDGSTCRYRLEHPAYGATGADPPCLLG